MDKLTQNIISYLEYLTESCGLCVSVHFSESTLNLLPPDIHSSILRFNSHTNAYCISVKGGNHGKCLCHQKNIISSCDTESFCLTCHAGVLEYIFPVLKKEKAIGYIAVSGYRAKLPPQNLRDLRLWESALCEEEIPKHLCDAVLPPLQMMLSQLFLHFSKGTANEYNMIVQFLNEYHNNITLSDLCSHFGRSKSYISHMFKRESGFSLRAYCNSLKLRDAAMMLKDTDISITDIAFDTGFNDASYFIALFRREYGVSPLKYRKGCTKHV